MAVEPAPDPLERAVRAARADQPPGWIELSASIMSHVRSVVTPAQPILAFTDQGESIRDEHNSRTFVSARVVTAALRRLLQRPTHAPSAIDLTVESDRLTGIHVELVCTYQVDLVELGNQVRVDALEQIGALLGNDPVFDLTHVRVTVIDVVVGDPNTH